MIAGLMTREEQQEIVQTACPGPGGCGGMYTASTMATSIEVRGNNSQKNSWNVFVVVCVCVCVCACVTWSLF